MKTKLLLPVLSVFCLPAKVLKTIPAKYRMNNDLLTILSPGYSFRSFIPQLRTFAPCREGTGYML